MADEGWSISLVLDLGLGRSVYGEADLSSSALLRPHSAQNTNKVVICWIWLPLLHSLLMFPYVVALLCVSGVVVAIWSGAFPRYVRLSPIEPPLQPHRLSPSRAPNLAHVCA